MASPCRSRDREFGNHDAAVPLIGIWRNMEPGDHICVRRRLLGPISYAHHGIYISRKQVIHFDGAPFRDKSDSVIRSCTLDEFAPGGWIGVIPYEGFHHYNHIQVIERAESQIGGQHDYSLFNWNCNRFATWCVTGGAGSFQAGTVNRGRWEVWSSCCPDSSSLPGFVHLAGSDGTR
jgi:Lecithin retinol acyltransferase